MTDEFLQNFQILYYRNIGFLDIKFLNSIYK